MNEYPTERKRKTLHLSPYSDSSGISRIADVYFDNENDDSDTETSSVLPKFTGGIKTRNRNQYNLIPEKSADIDICDEDFDSPESDHQQTQEESPTEVPTAKDVPVVAEVHQISEDYDQTDEESPAKPCRIVGKSQALNYAEKVSLPASDQTSKLHEEDPYICKYCDYKTESCVLLGQELSLHFQEHSFDGQHLCLFCEHEANDPEGLHSHVVNEHASLLSKITLDKCKNFFVSQACGFQSRLHTNVNRYVAIEHIKFFSHVYDDCGKGFSSMLEYCKDLNRIYLKGFAYTEDFKIHLDHKHLADLPHNCSECLMKFGNERELISQFPVHETP
ncbi:hypothetical protein FD755_013558 [Muntiacus reevesi]|uniref:C2H2-type domain-containing protein n=1 Tax=Muntiacus reevesi TaxID=9886 RepID=A0A5N3XMB5_MUNRE|nr:hypothetical protein FD755_013558 [Muntiacus reevesi]